jgi:hypothetical protein
MRRGTALARSKTIQDDPERRFSEQDPKDDDTYLANKIILRMYGTWRFNTDFTKAPGP